MQVPLRCQFQDLNEDLLHVLVTVQVRAGHGTVDNPAGQWRQEAVAHRRTFAWPVVESANCEVSTFFGPSKLKVACHCEDFMFARRPGWLCSQLDGRGCNDVAKHLGGKISGP